MFTFAVISIFCALVTFGSVWGFDRLVRRQYLSHREEWISCDKPCGFFFAPPGATHWGGDLAMKNLHFRWLFRPPVWVANDRASRRALFVMRASSASFVILFAGVAIAFIAQ